MIKVYIKGNSDEILEADYGVDTVTVVTPSGFRLAISHQFFKKNFVPVRLPNRATLLDCEKIFGHVTVSIPLVTI